MKLADRGGGGSGTPLRWWCGYAATRVMQLWQLQGQPRTATPSERAQSEASCTVPETRRARCRPCPTMPQCMAWHRLAGGAGPTERHRRDATGPDSLHGPPASAHLQHTPWRASC